MTSFGRGRGWSSLNKEQSLRRPGGLYCHNDAMKNIIDMLVTSGTQEDSMSQTVQDIVDLLTNSVPKENLRDVCDMLWKQGINNDTFTTMIAMVFSNNKIALMEDNNKETIRTRFLHFLQDNYMSREKNKSEDKKIFANIVLLHAEVFHHMRLHNGDKLNILVEPLIHYLGDMLENSCNESIHFIMVQMFRSGKDLHTACPDQLNDFIMTIRQALISKTSSNSLQRALLLLIIELTNNNYEIKDVRLKQFYLSSIKPYSFDRAVSLKELKLKTETKIDDQILKNSEEIDNNVPSHRIIKEETSNDVSKSSHHSKGPVIPRAIRGTGGLDAKKEDSVNAKLNSLKVTSPRQKNAGFWDHDDRFHKDYN